MLTLTRARTRSDWFPNQIQEQKSNRRAKNSLISSATTTMDNPLDIFHSRFIVKGEGERSELGGGMSKQVPIKALNDREVNGVIVLLVSQLDVKCRNSCDEAAHSKVLRDPVYFS